MGGSEISRFNFRFNNISDLKQQILDNSINIVAQAVPTAVNNGKDLIVSKIAESFFSTEIWSAVRGDFAGDDQLDLQAQLGVPDNIVAEAEREILDAFSDTFRVSDVKIIKNNRAVSFSLSFPGILDELRSLPVNNAIDIPWLEFLLDGGSVDGYTIFFGIDFAEFSRTGRAIMVDSTSLDWDIISYSSDLFTATQTSRLNDEILKIISDNLESVLT